jgi:predicted RNase H-related nuclease YkuK (DUF458 family)
MNCICRWGYSQDERDSEIAELKKRLVEEQRKAKESALKAADELKAVVAELQVDHGGSLHFTDDHDQELFTGLLVG